MASVVRSTTGVALACAAAANASAFSLPRFSKPHARAPVAAPTPLPVKPLAPSQWPQARSDLAPDPAIRFGTLANGMRYAILRNVAPAGAVSVRLRIAAGSLVETDEEAGLAHLLEHLAFDGSRAVPAGGMAKLLEGHGLSFAADTNAVVSFDATTYKLDLAKADDGAIDVALMLLREIAGELTLGDEAVERERGVVLAEQNGGDTPAWRIFKARLSFLLDGQRPPRRFPIGTVSAVQGATREKIAAFYRRWYRPERATLIVTGDVDVAAIEARIRARFADWSGMGPAAADPDPGPVETRGARARLAVEPNAPTSVELAWTSPPDLSADSRARSRRDLVSRLAMAVINRRLASAALADDPPFLSAGAFGGDQLRAARVTGLIVAAEPGGWEKALDAADQEQRRAVAYGVRPDELAREVAQTRAELAEAAADAAKRLTPRLADQMTGSLEGDLVETSPVQDLALFDETVKALTADQVSAALKTAFAGSGPLIFVSSPAPIEGGEAAVRTAWLSSNARAVDAPAVTTAAPWPYGDFGEPSKVVAQKEISDLDTVLVTFANGVRLTVKPTKFHDDEVMVKVRLGPGLQALPADRQGAAWAAGGLIDGGLARISQGDAARALASAVYGAQARIEDDALALTGTTRRDDLDTQLQVLAAYVADPGWRPEAFQRARARAAALLDQYGRTGSGILERDLPGLLRAGDRRWTFPSREEVTAATPDDLKARIGATAAGPLEVVIVGDITVEKAIDAAQRTFGALAARPSSPAPPARPLGFPAPNAAPLVLTHGGRADRAIGLVAWRTDDLISDPRGARAASLLADVIQRRLGEARSPRAAAEASLVWPHWGFVSAQVEVPPENLDAFFTDAARICADLRDREVQPEEFERARKARLEAIAGARGTNDYWLAALSGAQGDPRRLDAIRAEPGGYEAITPADLRRAAQKVLRDEATWKLEVRPTGAAPQ